MGAPILDLEIPLQGPFWISQMGGPHFFISLYLFLFSVSFHFCLLLSRSYLFSSICGAHLQSTSTSCGRYWRNSFNFVLLVLHVPFLPSCVVVFNLDKTIPWYVVHQWMNWSISEHQTSLFFFSYFAWINANGDWRKMIVWQWILLDI